MTGVSLCRSDRVSRDQSSLNRSETHSIENSRLPLAFGIHLETQLSLYLTVAEGIHNSTQQRLACETDDRMEDLS